MSLRGLPAEFEQFVERARTALGQEITASKNIATAAKAETAAAQTALAELQNQYKQTKNQFDAVNNELGQTLTLAGLNREIAAARKALEKLKVKSAPPTRIIIDASRKNWPSSTRHKRATRQCSIGIGSRSAGRMSQTINISSVAFRNFTRRRRAFTRAGAIGIGACANGPPILAPAV
jgi:hypothetical protein